DVVYLSQALEQKFVNDWRLDVNNRRKSLNQQSTATWIHEVFTSQLARRILPVRYAGRIDATGSHGLACWLPRCGRWGHEIHKGFSGGLHRHVDRVALGLLEAG